MGVDTVEFARLVVISVALLGYLLVGIAHWRHDIRWVFSAYTALVAGAVLLLIGTVSELPFLSIIPSVAVATAALLFFVATWKSEQQINALDAKIQGKTVSLSGDGDRP